MTSVPVRRHIRRVNCLPKKEDMLTLKKDKEVEDEKDNPREEVSETASDDA